MIIAGSTVIVTGTSSGIGRALSEAFVKQGAGLVVCVDCRTRSENAKVKAVEDGRMLEIIADLRDWSTHKRIVARALSCSPNSRIDVVVNCAGINDYETLDTNSFWAEENNEATHSYDVLDVNFAATVHFTRAVIGQMLWQDEVRELQRQSCERRGVVIVVGSLGAQSSWLFQPVYCCSKAALMVFARSIAGLEQLGIRSACFNPGYVFTPMTAGEDGIEGQRNHSLPVFEAGDAAEALIGIVTSEKMRSGDTISMSGNKANRKDGIFHADEDIANASRHELAYLSDRCIDEIRQRYDIA